MAKIARDNFQLAMKYFFYGNDEDIRNVYENENIINTLEKRDYRVFNSNFPA